MHALIPLKDLVRAKTRLSGLLSSSERRALAQAMVEDVLACVSAHPAVEQLTLVSDDPAAPLLAAANGCSWLAESDLACHGLNPVLTAAVARLPASADDLLIVLHGDLPALSPGDIDAALALAGAGCDLVIGCDSVGTGTNLLLFPRSRVPQFAFGTDSCARHRAQAEAAGALCKVLQTYGIGLDIDEPGDLASLLEASGRGLVGKHTACLLAGGLEARLRHALASLEGGGADVPGSFGESR